MKECLYRGVFEPYEVTKQFSVAWGKLCDFDNEIKRRHDEEGIIITIEEIIRYRALRFEVDKNYQTLQHVLERHCIY